MSSKTKTITQLVEELQSENERLKSLEKLFNKACKEEFGFDVKTLHSMIEKAKLFDQRHNKQEHKKVEVYKE